MPSFSVVSFIMAVAWVLIAILVYFENSKPQSFQRVFQYKRNKQEYYVEYRRWKLWWGLTLDSERETNKLIDSWNDNGYICTYFQHSGLFPNTTIFRTILITIVYFSTFGFIGYYFGPSLLFVRSKEKEIKNVDDYGDFYVRGSDKNPAKGIDHPIKHSISQDSLRHEEAQRSRNQI